MPTAANGTTISTSYVTAVKALKVAREIPSGYARAKFKHWNDADHDCRNARAEVLAAESRSRTTGGCTIKTGRWTSAYDNVIVTEASKLDIDHMVPLAEAWGSGARTWSSAKREAYANDQAERKSLVAVTAHANRSKGDRDPGEWQPIQNRCSYLAAWVTVKTRWGLSIDPAERQALLVAVNKCGNPIIKTHKATVKNAPAGSSTSPGPGMPGNAGSDPRFGTCTEAKAHGYGPYRSGRDPEYAWYTDRDSDGLVCE